MPSAMLMAYGAAVRTAQANPNAVHWAFRPHGARDLFIYIFLGVAVLHLWERNQPKESSGEQDLP